MRITARFLPILSVSAYKSPFFAVFEKYFCLAHFFAILLDFIDFKV